MGGADRQALGRRFAQIRAVIAAGQVTPHVTVGCLRPGRTGIPRCGLGVGPAVGRGQGCRIARGPARPRRGRKRLVGGKLGPVLLVGELVPFRTRPVVVIIALAPLPGPALAIGRNRRRFAPWVPPVPGVIRGLITDRGELHRGLVTGRVAICRSEVHGRVVGRGEVVGGGAPGGIGVVTPPGLGGCPDSGAGSRLLAVAGCLAGRPPWCAVVVAATRRPVPGRSAGTVAGIFAAPPAAAGRGHRPGIPVPPVLAAAAGL